jgi:hypothetical protein
LRSDGLNIRGDESMGLRRILMEIVGKRESFFLDEEFCLRKVDRVMDAQLIDENGSFLKRRIGN